MYISQSNNLNATESVPYIKKAHNVEKPKSHLAIYIFIAVCVLLICCGGAYLYYKQPKELEYEATKDFTGGVPVPVYNSANPDPTIDGTAYGGPNATPVSYVNNSHDRNVNELQNGLWNQRHNKDPSTNIGQHTEIISPQNNKKGRR